MLIRSGSYLVNTDKMLYAQHSDPTTDNSPAEVFFSTSSLILDDTTIDELWDKIQTQDIPAQLAPMLPGEDPVDYLNRLTKEPQ